MLPSQGLFRSIPCPFFLAGLCERPHCSFRHCRSDIRIDRKLESESLDETTPSEDTVETKNSATHNATSAKAQPESSKEPVVNRDCTSSSASSSCSSKPEINTKEVSQPERLNSTDNAEVQNSTVVEPSRKRSRDSDSKDSSKRRKISSDTTSDMGGIVSKVKSIVTSAASSCSSKSDTSSSNSSSSGGKRKEKDKTDDIDRLVEEIEKSGKSPSSTDSHRNRKSHKHHRHKHSSRHKEGDDTKDSSSGSSSSSHRKENRSSKEDSHHHKRSSDERKDKDKDSKKDSKKDQHHGKHSDYHKRRKDSNDSVSSSNSHKRIRKSSSCNDTEDGKRHEKRNSSSEHSSRKKEHSTTSTPKRDDGRSSKSSTEKGVSDIAKETLKSVQQNNSIDTTNRFNVLAESSADDESAYNSDVFDESLDFKYPGGSDSEDDPELVARECLELFENYKPEVPSKSETKDSSGEPVSRNNNKEDDLDEGFCVVGKKRVAHANAIMKAPSTPVSAPKQPPATSKNLQDTLLKRFEEQSKSRINVQNGCMASSSSTPTSPKPGTKLRIAHVPNAGKLAQKPVLTSTSKSASGQGSLPGQPGSLTYSQTVAKGVKREAHKPSSSVVTKQGPIIFKDAINKSTKIPHITRQQIMDKMFAEYCRILDNHEQAFQMTVTRENELIGKCSSKQVYYSSGISIISGLRKASKQENDHSFGPNRVISHQHILSGGSLEARNCSVRTVKKEGIPTGNALYKALRKYIMTEQQLIDNGYPRPHPSGEHGRALAKPRAGEENSMTLTNRICDRCKKRYMTTEEGEHIVSEVCNYHWGRKFTTSSRAGRGTRESTYVCCGSEDDKIGCVTSICHVSKCPVPISSQKGFVEAVLEEGHEDKMGENPWDIIGIDCEMVYTTHGNELARVTIVGVDRKVLYDEIVKPTHKVLDCNSRFSGITFDDMDNAKRTITEVQAIILTHLRPNTIIIGHSLESDLIALRLKHECVIDTSILYPHRLGPPKKRALKNLSVDILKKVIQESDSGHDSAEDAQIAVELVIAKLKSDCTNK